MFIIWNFLLSCARDDVVVGAVAFSIIKIQAQHEYRANQVVHHLDSAILKDVNIIMNLLYLLRKMPGFILLALLLSACQFQGGTTPTPAPTSTPIVAPLTGWPMVFHDEFDGSQLDSNLWTTEYLWGRTNSPELQYYAPDSFLFKDGILSIRAENQLTEGMDYSSGVITSFDSFQFTYGYVEARIRIPSGQGLWPALWLLDVAGGADEIDIVEFLGHEPNTVYMTLHYADESGEPQGTGDGHYHGADFSADFHTFGVNWSPTEIIWYIDGVEQYRHTHDIPDGPMYLIANMAVGGNWPGPPDDTTRFPAFYEIDYIRIFQK